MYKFYEFEIYIDIITKAEYCAVNYASLITIPKSGTTQVILETFIEENYRHNTA